jgi:hypothetical protein
MDKPTTTELLEWLGFVLGSASFGGKAEAIRAILADYPKLQAELAQAEPLLKAALAEDDCMTFDDTVLDAVGAYRLAYRKAVEGAKEGEKREKASPTDGEDGEEILKAQHDSPPFGFPKEQSLAYRKAAEGEKDGGDETQAR